MSLFRKKSIDVILAQAAAGDADAEKHGLTKTLGVRDLTAFGIAAIIGAGIFSTIGKASAMGGPGVILLFVATAIACGFAALAYAEFASLVPVSGSAYTYSYVAFGELFAWIIGWALILEYAIGNITVAISWSDYFTSLCDGALHWHIPDWLTMDYLTAKSGFESVSKQLADGATMEAVKAGSDYSKYLAWSNAPTLGGFHFVFDAPAIGITILITWLVYRGMRETRTASNIMVALKLAVVVLVIIVGSAYVDTSNWSPFLPNGVGGLLGGISAVFFAYIGFDAISTTAEECKNPQRDMPRGIIYSIIICTVLYVLIALVITGMVNYSELNVGDPLAYVFEKIKDVEWLSRIIAVSAIVAVASVLLVFQLGQPRIWLAMSRDGLLPKAFSRIHPRYRTPSFATIVTGFMVAVPALFLDMNIVIDACSLGTLFAFVLVCAGILKLEMTPGAPRGKFKVPRIPSRFIAPTILVISVILIMVFIPDWPGDFVRARQLRNAETMTEYVKDNSTAAAALQTALTQQATVTFSDSAKTSAAIMLASIPSDKYETVIRNLAVDDAVKYESGWHVFKHLIPVWLFLFISLWMVYICIMKNISLIPVLGLTSCLYMMSQLGWKNWLLFMGWLVIGLIIYFGYSRRNSKLNPANQNA